MTHKKLLAAALALAWAGQGGAAEFDTGVTGLSLRWDNTLRYNLGARMEAQDKRLLSSATFDESDAKFGKHDVVTNRLDWLTEMDLNYDGKVGARVSAAAWFDHAYRDSTVKSVVPGYASSYFNDTYSKTVDRFVHGPSGELLDAFVWTNFSLGDVPVNVKVGRHTNVWGEGLLLGQHAISYSQSPVDGVKAVTSPGIETKEVFLPIGQISAKAQVTDNLSVAAQYFYEWASTRAPHGGTYLSGPDTTFEVDRVAAAPGFVLNRVPSFKPKDRGNFGVNARYNMESIESTLGLYYRQFDDYTPWTGSEFNVPARQFRFAYPSNVKLIGASFARVIGPVSAGAEISYRKGAGLHSTTTGVSLTDHEGTRGNTWHAIVNGVMLLPETPLWTTGSLVAELAYSRLSKVTSHPELFKGEGYACIKTGTTIVAGDKSDGCATKDFAALAVSFTPQYLNILPSWNLDVPMTLNYGLHGNAPTGGGGFEHALTWSVGLRATYAQVHEFSLRYSDARADKKYNAAGTTVIGGAGLSSTLGATDRGWLVFTYKTGF
ncbi:MAG: DUF1302 domain-containing protein [Burkholderiaceae bacterium]|nr:DUF1302 domain-containing protein [Burkholderiaceae bacterium]